MAQVDAATRNVLLLSDEAADRALLADHLGHALGAAAAVEHRPLAAVRELDQDPDLVVLDLRNLDEEEESAGGPDAPVVRMPLDRDLRPIGGASCHAALHLLAGRLSPRTEWIVAAPEERWPAIRRQLGLPVFRFVTPGGWDLTRLAGLVSVLIDGWREICRRVPAEAGRRWLEDCADGQMLLDGDGVVHYANGAAAAMFGMCRGDMLGAPFGRPVAHKGLAEVTLRNGQAVEMQVSNSSLAGAPGQLVSLRRVVVPKSAMRRALAQIQVSQSVLAREAVTDAATGALNRRGLENMLAVERSRSGRGMEPCAAVVCSLVGGLDGTQQWADQDLNAATQAIVEVLTDETGESTSIAVLAPGTCLALIPGMRLGVAVERGRSLEPMLRKPRWIGDQRITGGDAAVAAVDVDPSRGLQALVQQVRRALAGQASTPEDTDSASFRSTALPMVRLADGQPIGHAVAYAIGDLSSWDPRIAFALHEAGSDADYFAWRCFEQGLQRAAKLPGQIHVDIYPRALLRGGGEPLAASVRDHLAGRDVWLRLPQDLLGSDPAPVAAAVERIRRDGIRLVLSGFTWSRDSLAAFAMLEPDAVAVSERMLQLARVQHDEPLRRTVALCRVRSIPCIGAGSKALANGQALAAAGVDVADGSAPSA